MWNCLDATRTLLIQFRTHILSGYETLLNWLATKWVPTRARLCIDRNVFMISGLFVKCFSTKVDWTMWYYPPPKKCKLDSLWLGPYLAVSIGGWAIGVQLQPDSPVLLVHCQDFPDLGVWCHGCQHLTDQYFNYRIAVLRDGIKQATRTACSRNAERSFLDDVSLPWGQQMAVIFQIVYALCPGCAGRNRVCYGFSRVEYMFTWLRLVILGRVLMGIRQHGVIQRLLGIGPTFSWMEFLRMVPCLSRRHFGYPLARGFSRQCLLG